ncbi:MAG: SpoIIE family protein phosphatase [Chromatiaceae bacterium]
MKTIRAKMLLGFGLLLMCLLSLLGAYLYFQVKATVVPLTQELSQEVLRARSVGLGNLFRGYLSDIRTLSRDSVIRSGDLDAIQRELEQRVTAINSDYEMVFFADTRGRYVGSTGSTGYVGDRAYWQAILREGQAEVISEPVISRATGATVFVVAAGVRDQQGQPIGLIAATVLLDTLTEIAGAIGIGAHGFGWVMDHQGLLIAHPVDSLRLQLNLLQSASRGYEGLEEIGQTLARGESGFGTYRRPDGTLFATLYTPIPHTPNWGLGVSLPEAELMGRAHNLLQALLWGMALVIGAVLLLVFVVSGRIAAPVRELMRGVEYVSAGHLDYQLEVRTGDEIQTLAEDFNHMTGDLKEHIRNLARVTAEKARVDGELRAANRIQASMLPRIFPPDLDIANLDLYATMEPAKEVGGDFYDFYLLDDRRLCFCIGDVSGKGVPAALFMVIGMTILKNLVRQGQPLDQVFIQANKMLCSENDMFITAFMGILDTATGELEYVSAGHNPPLIAQGGADFDYLDTPIHLFLGGMEDVGYQSSRLILAPGDCLFVYTDGLNEAQNAQGAFYTGPRMVAAINGLKHRGVRDLIGGMREAVAAFVQEAPAADDLTMLALTITPQGDAGAG